MALTPPTVIPLIQAGLTGNSIGGVSAPQLTIAISNGFIQYATSILIVNTKDTGTAGIGSGSGFGLLLIKSILISSLQSTFTANNIKGPMRNNLINAIAIGISQSLKSAMVSTLHTGVGSGTGIITLVPNTKTAITLMITNFVATGIVGAQSLVLATAIAQGIDLSLPSAMGNVIIVGTASPYSAVGVGTGKVL